MEARILSVLLLTSLSATGLGGESRPSGLVARSSFGSARESARAAANGMGVNLPLVARLIGAGPTLYISTVDVQNHSTADTQVDFYFDGVNLRTSDPIALNGSISSTGSLVAQGTGGPMRARFNAHFDDFIDSLVQGGMLPASIEQDGFIGSVLFVFNGFTKRGQGSAQVRFYNSFGGGTIGEALKGHEVTTNEPQSLVAPVAGDH